MQQFEAQLLVLEAKLPRFGRPKARGVSYRSFQLPAPPFFFFFLPTPPLFFGQPLNKKYCFGMTFIFQSNRNNIFLAKHLALCFFLNAARNRLALSDPSSFAAGHRQIPTDFGAVPTLLQISLFFPFPFLFLRSFSKTAPRGEAPSLLHLHPDRCCWARLRFGEEENDPGLPRGSLSQEKPVPGRVCRTGVRGMGKAG